MQQFVALLVVAYIIVGSSRMHDIQGHYTVANIIGHLHASFYI